MKHKVLIGLLIITILTLPLFSAKSMFKKGGIYVTPKVALYTWAFNFGANVEYGLTENIGAGGDFMMAFVSNPDLTLLTPSAFVSYHFTQIDVEKLDVFASLYMGFGIVSYKNPVIAPLTNAFFLNPTAGARYYFTEKIAAYVNFTFAVLGVYTGVGGVVGVTFAL